MTSQLGVLTPVYVEKKTGDDLAPQLEKAHGGVLQDPALTEYVASVGRRMLPWSDRGEDKHTYKVLSSDKIVNAFTLGNGSIYVTRGLLNIIDDEAQLAEVLGHENGHYGLRHIAKQLDRALGTVGLLAVAESIFVAVKGKGLSDRDQKNIAAANKIIPALVLNGFGREQELEADGHGLKTMAAAGYDPRASISLFERFQKLEPKVEGLQVFFQSHPTAKARIDDLAAGIRMNYPEPGGQLFRDRYQEAVHGAAPSGEAGEGEILGMSPTMAVVGGLGLATLVTVLAFSL